MKPGAILSYLQMCSQEGVNLQRGMNYHLRGGVSVILMSLRPGAPYADRIEDNGRVLIYEGHDMPRRRGSSDPKMLDQPMTNPNRTLTQNGLFYQAAISHKETGSQPEIVRVYEKVRPGIWVYNGLFKLVDSWLERDRHRRVFKFRLQLADDSDDLDSTQEDLEHTRLIPASVKLQVWQRDKGMCVICGSIDNLHFDHIVPYSRGGSSLVAANIRLLCARHNLAKSDRIEYA